MTYLTEHIAQALRAARESHGLSQRELSMRTGVTQSHISKIENGAVDLRLSSLISLARVLDLEVALVPRKSMGAVEAIVRSVDAPSSAASTGASRSAARELQRLQDAVADAATAHPSVSELARLQRQVRELGNFRSMVPRPDPLREARKAVDAFRDGTRGIEAIREAVSQLQTLRDTVANTPRRTGSETVRPAYSLDEDGDG